MPVLVPALRQRLARRRTRLRPVPSPLPTLHHCPSARQRWLRMRRRTCPASNQTATALTLCPSPRLPRDTVSAWRASNFCERHCSVCPAIECASTKQRLFYSNHTALACVHCTRSAPRLITKLLRSGGVFRCQHRFESIQPRQVCPTRTLPQHTWSATCTNQQP